MGNHLSTDLYRVNVLVIDAFAFVSHTVMPYNSAHHCVVEVENFLLLLGGEDQWNPNGTVTTQTECLAFQ